MTAIAADKRMSGHILRSGGAQGADKAFEAGAENQKEIFRPHHATAAAYELTAKYHPTWHKCSPAARALHARNAHIILGFDLKTPVELVICWTKDASGSGGTGQGIRIALAYGIPIHDMGHPVVHRYYKHHHGEHTCA